MPSSHSAVEERWWALVDRYEELDVRNTYLESSPPHLLFSNMATAKGLHKAVAKCRFRHLKFLLDCGAELDLKNEQGEGVLLTALRISNDRFREKMFYFLLKKGASCDEIDLATGRDTFLWTCYLGRDTQAKQLLRLRHGDINFLRKDNDGNTGLHYIVKARMMDLTSAVVKCMQRFGISVDIPDSNGVTPCIHARRLGYSEIEEILVKEGEACPTQLDFETLHLLGSSQQNGNSSKQRRVASAFCHGSILNVSQKKRCFSSASRSSSFHGWELNRRKAIRNDDGDDMSRSCGSAQSRNSHIWSETALLELKNGGGTRSTTPSSSNKSCWTPTPSLTTTSSVKCNGHSGTRGEVGSSSAGPSKYKCTEAQQSVLNVTSISGKTMNQSSSTPKTSGPMLFERVNVRRALSPQSVDPYRRDRYNNVIKPAIRCNRQGIPVVHTMFQYKSVQLTPAFRPQVDIRKVTPTPKQRAKANERWGMISFMAKLKAKGQKAKMQALLKAGGGGSGQASPVN